MTLTPVEACREAIAFLSGQWRDQAWVLGREKESQVAAQNFDAAAVLRDQLRDYEAYWNQKAVCARIRKAIEGMP